MWISLPWVNISAHWLSYSLHYPLSILKIQIYQPYYILLRFFCFPAADDDEIPQELLLGKHQLSELGSESAKIKAMGISSRVTVVTINIKTFRWTLSDV